MISTEKSETETDHSENDYIFPGGICTECKHHRDLHNEDEDWLECSSPGCNCGNNTGR